MFFGELLKLAAPENNWQVGGKYTHDIFGHRKPGVCSESYHVRMIRAILSLLSHTQVIKGGVTLMELGEADPDILPLSDEVLKRRAQKQVA